MKKRITKFSLLPNTRLGKWSMNLIIAFFLLFLLFQLLILSGQRGGNTFFDNLLLSIPWLFMVVCGIASFFTGTISIIKKKERAVFVFLSTALGFFILLFVLGEFLFPH